MSNGSGTGGVRKLELARVTSEVARKSDFGTSESSETGAVESARYEVSGKSGNGFSERHGKKDANLS
jgi:hypothetical protein